MKRRDDTLTPEQREERIAELRARRRARLRVLAFRSAIATAVLVILGGIGLYWLLQTVAGRDVLLAQIVARLPANSSFTWKQADGPLAGPLTLRGVEFRWDKIHFTADKVYLDPDLRPLLGRRLRLDGLQIENAMLDIPESDEPFELPSWPESLPQIEMPLAIQADTLIIDGFVVKQSGESMIAIARARGGIDIGNGYFHAENLAVDSDRGNFRVHGGYAPRNDYLTDVQLTAVFPAPLGKAPARLGLVARGNVDAMSLGIGGNAPAPLRVALSVRGREQPTWRFTGHTELLDLQALAITDDSLPLGFDLRGEGARGEARLQGRVRQGDLAVVIDPSYITLKGDVLSVQPLVVRALEGVTTLRGQADFTDRENPVFKFAVNARGLRWGDNAETAIGGDADLGVAGKLKAWAAKGNARLVRADERAQAEFTASGDDQRASIQQLRAKMPTGSLEASGDVAWAPVLSWDAQARLAGFDPGYFIADWDGNLSGDFSSKGQARQTEGFDATLDLPRLTGRLRGRQIDARGNFALHGNNGEGQLAMTLGSSRVQAKGKVGDALAVDAQLTPLHLNDLLPTGSGTLSGTLKLTGTRTAPNIDADLIGNALHWDTYSAEQLSLRGHLPWRGSNGELIAQARQVNVGVVLEELNLNARGAIENLRFDGNTRNDMGAISLSGTALHKGETWQGTLDTLRIAPSKGSPWQLQQAARFSQRGSTFTLSQACLAANTGDALCAQADWPRQGVTVKADALPLSLIHPWLPENNGRPITLRGVMSVDAQVRPRGTAYEGKIHLASLDGGLKLGNNARGEIIAYDNFTFDADLNPQRIQARLGTGFKGNGYVDATVNTGWDDFSPLKGDLYFHNSRLFWLELFSPDLVRPRGQLAGHIGLAGTRGKPALSGEADLTEFTGELPALGITLSEGTVRLLALADGSASINGTVKSGEGVLKVDGSLGWNNDTTPLQFNVSGNNVLVANTPDLRAIASPNVQVGFADNTIQVRGEVTVPSATINVEKLDRGVSASEDVVVLDPEDPERAPSSRLDLDLGITLGDAVALKGYGLEGTITGKMQVRSRPGRDMVATGRLDVDGRYEAYGQKLQITRGELTWSNNEISDPRINIRAQREVVSANTTAGIDVTGRASSPRAKVWSDPATSESEALSYLILGRSLGSASRDETQSINAASSALGAGAGLLASQLGAKIGLDDAGVLESRTLGGSVFGVGKYLSPRLYVSYGVSMVGAGSVVTLKYLLRKGFDAEIESSTIETRGSINWRKEK